MINQEFKKNSFVDFSKYLFNEEVFINIMSYLDVHTFCKMRVLSKDIYDYIYIIPNNNYSNLYFDNSDIKIKIHNKGLNLILGNKDYFTIILHILSKYKKLFLISEFLINNFLNKMNNKKCKEYFEHCCKVIITSNFF
jgi:hypothetical protein